MNEDDDTAFSVYLGCVFFCLFDVYYCKLFRTNHSEWLRDIILNSQISYRILKYSNQNQLYWKCRRHSDSCTGDACGTLYSTESNQIVNFVNCPAPKILMTES